MKVMNVTRNSAISENILVADTLAKKTSGLAGLDKPASLYFKTRWGIHTFGMKFSIDCVVCDDELVVKFIRKAIPANRLVFWSPRYKNVFEFPASAVGASGTEVGDMLRPSIPTET